MTIQTAPTYNIGPLAGFATLKTAMTNYDGTDSVGSTFALLCTCGGHTNNLGSLIARVRFKPRPVSSGSTSANNVASMAYLFGNNGSANTAAANNWLIATVPLPATTGGTTGLVAMLETNIIELPVPQHLIQANGSDATAFPMALPDGYKIYVGLGTTVSAGWDVFANYGYQ